MLFNERKFYGIGCIYIIRNTINDLVYIGQTTKTAEIRFKQHCKLLKSNKNQMIYKAIELYGKDKFYYEVLEDNVDDELLNEKEEHYILKFKSFEKGYNLCGGGTSSRVKKVIENEKIPEIIEKYKTGKFSIREIARFYGVHHQTISNILKYNNIKIVNRNKSNINITDELKIKISEMYNSNMSTKDIAEKLDISRRTVNRYKNYSN